MDYSNQSQNREHQQSYTSSKDNPPNNDYQKPPPHPFGNSGIDFNKIQTLLQLFTGLNGSKSGNPFNLHNHSSSQASKDQKHDFDEKISTQEMKVLKSVLPFFDYNTSKQLGIFIKMMELKNTFDYYENPSEEFASQSQDPHWKKNMLLSMRSHCSNDKQCLIDFALKSLDMRDLANSFNSFNSNNTSQDENDQDSAKNATPTMTSNNGDLMNELTNMLNPEQKQMFNTFNSMMKTMGNKERENNDER